MLLLLVEDELHIRLGIAEMLAGEGYQVLQAEGLQQAMACIDEEGPDAVLADINLPDGDGLALLDYCAGLRLEIPMIFMTAFGSRDLALQAIGRGAYDYITKPIRFDELFARLHRLRERERLKGQIQRKAMRKREAGRLALLGESAAMRAVRRAAEKAIHATSPVLITGETGVGKGLLAKLIHTSGAHGELPFVSINCASIPESLLESELFGYLRGAFTGADRNKKGLLDEVKGGTLFLDEVGELPLPLQAKLLHVLDDGRFRPLGGMRDHRFAGRIIAATNVPMERLLAEKRFRSDLYYRLSVLTIEIPPLRERVEDILPLAERIYRELAAELGRPRPAALPASLAAELMRQRWPGNVRQLRNHLERHLIFGEAEERTDAGTPPLAGVVRDFERAWIRRTIAECRGDKSAAAKRLGIGLSTLYRKLDGE